MSFYRTLLAAVAAVAIASPVFAEDPSMQPGDNNTSTTTTTTEQQTTSTTTETKININKASAKELMKVKGINAAKARAIVAYRKKHNGFTSTDELSKVKGFQKLKSDALKEIEDQVSID